MKNESKEKKRRVFARLLAQELKTVKAGVATVTCVTTYPEGKSRDYTNLSWDHDDPPPK